MIILRQKLYSFFGNKKSREEKERDKFEESYKKKYVVYGNPGDLLFVYALYKNRGREEISTTPNFIYDSKRPKYRIKELDDLYKQGMRRVSRTFEKDNNNRITKAIYTEIL